jgi:chromate reductase
MITLIAGTNRPNSYTKKVAELYSQLLGSKNVPYTYFSLEGLPSNLFDENMYDFKANEAFYNIQKNILYPATKFIFIVPEYNGSFPGVFKSFIDASDVKNCFHNKKAALVGVSDGRAGNLRGMEHLTNILNHIKINTLHLKIPISSVAAQFDNSGNFINTEILKLMETQIDELLLF